MKLFVHVFDDNCDQVELCFRSMKSIAAADVSFNGIELTGGKLGFQIKSVGVELVQVLVRVLR